MYAAVSKDNVFGITGVRHNIGSFLRVKVVVNTEAGRCKRLKK